MASLIATKAGQKKGKALSAREVCEEKNCPFKSLTCLCFRNFLGDMTQVAFSKLSIARKKRLQPSVLYESMTYDSMENTLYVTLCIFRNHT